MISFKRPPPWRNLWAGPLVVTIKTLIKHQIVTPPKVMHQRMKLRKMSKTPRMMLLLRMIRVVLPKKTRAVLTKLQMPRRQKPS